jgi:hypothetical protein
MIRLTTAADDDLVVRFEGMRHNDRTFFLKLRRITLYDVELEFAEDELLLTKCETITMTDDFELEYWYAVYFCDDTRWRVVKQYVSRRLGKFDNRHVFWQNSICD